MTAAGAMSWRTGILSAVRPSLEKWIGASRCVPPCSGVQNEFEE